MVLNDLNLKALFTKLGRTYSAGNVIFLEEEKGAEMYIIVSGEVEITKMFKEQEVFGGSRLTLGATSELLSILEPGDFFGEMALWNDEPRMASARAKTQVEVIVLGKADLETLMMRSPQLAVQMMKSICCRLRDVSSTPRLEIVLPQIQALLQSSRRAVTEQKPAEKKKPREREIAASSKSEVDKDKPPIVVAPENNPPPPSSDAIVSARTCSVCGYSVRSDDRYCGMCGRPLKKE